MRCENCGEVTPKETCVVLQDVVPLPKSRGQANLVQKVSLSSSKLCLLFDDYVLLYCEIDIALISFAAKFGTMINYFMNLCLSGSV